MNLVEELVSLYSSEGQKRWPAPPSPGGTAKAASTELSSVASRDTDYAHILSVEVLERDLHESTKLLAQPTTQGLAQPKLVRVATRPLPGWFERRSR